MKILSAVTKNYYGQPQAIEPMYLAFTLPLERLGHHVDHFDHVRLQEEVGPVECGDRFVRTARYGGYDLVLYQTGGRDHMVRDSISRAAKYVPILAFNSDDDWQWESYSRHLAPLFTWMVTTYPHVYEANRHAHGNLILGQWGCLDTYADAAHPKDLDFTFAGQIYRNRVPELRFLRKKAGLRIFGLGAMRVSCPPLNNRHVRKFVSRMFPACNKAMDFQQVNRVWNRSKISYTPMSASVNPAMLQIKSRAFEMGLSGTLMLGQASPGLERYYQPWKEFIPCYGLEDCVVKARYYLRNEAERRRIVEAYMRRTREEHMWERRWTELFRRIGVGARPLPRAKVA